MDNQKRYLGFLANNLCIEKQKFIRCCDSVPEFYDRMVSMLDTGRPVTDKSVFDVLLEIYDSHREENDFPTRFVRYLLNTIHKHLTGDNKTFDGRSGVGLRPIALPDEFSDMDGFIELISPLKASAQRAILYNTELMDIIRDTGYSSLEQIYNGFRKFFYNMRPSDGSDYYKFRNVASEFSRVLHNDPLWWTRDYEEHKPNKTTT